MAFPGPDHHSICPTCTLHFILAWRKSQTLPNRLLLACKRAQASSSSHSYILQRIQKRSETNHLIPELLNLSKILVISLSSCSQNTNCQPEHALYLKVTATGHVQGINRKHPAVLLVTDECRLSPSCEDTSSCSNHRKVNQSATQKIISSFLPSELLKNSPGMALLCYRPCCQGLKTQTRTNASLYVWDHPKFRSGRFGVCFFKFVLARQQPLCKSPAKLQNRLVSMETIKVTFQAILNASRI